MNRPGEKLIGFGMRLENWGPEGRIFDPGDLAWLSESDFWCLKTMWPDAIYDLTPVRYDILDEVFR